MGSMQDNAAKKYSFPDKVARRLLRKGIRYSNRWSEHFTTFHQRPKYAWQLGTWSEHDIPRVPMAIAMQGPIATDYDFTLETLKIYAEHMPGIRLILSTWNDTPQSLLDPIVRLGVELVLSDKPAVSGLFNINMQVVSAANGVRKAVEGGAEWVLKTRTDQRLYDPNAMNFLAATAKQFPVSGTQKQRHRIIGVGHGTLKFAPYHVTDQTVFGHAEDMLAYWTPPLRESPPPVDWPVGRSAVFSRVPIGELCRVGAAESYFASEFLMRMGRPLAWSIEDSWAAYRDHFCFVDYAATDFYWVKSQTYSLQEFTSEYDFVSNRREVGFHDWMLLYSGQLPCASARRYEGVLKTCFTAPVTVD